MERVKFLQSAGQKVAVTLLLVCTFFYVTAFPKDTIYRDTASITEKGFPVSLLTALAIIE